MKTRSPLKKLAAAALAASALVGCSVSAPSTANQPVVLPPAAEIISPAFQVLVDEKSDEHMEHAKKLKEFLAKLALTSEQKTQLKGVVRDAFQRAKSLQAEIRPIATAPEIDRAALTMAIQNAMAEDAAQDAQTLEGVRVVLTESQRALIADKLTEMSKKEDDAHTKLFEALMEKAKEQVTMTDAQKEGFSKLKTAFMGYWKSNRSAYYMVMAAHMHDGNQERLRMELAKLNANMPVETMVDFMASLNQEQRQKLATWKEKLMEKIQSKLTD
ncbi:hypothetical protein D3C86_368810 [compost metagenome]